MQAEKLMEQAQAEGMVEIQDGVWLWMQEQTLKEQAEWQALGIESPRLDFDFKQAPFWVTDNTGLLEPIYDATDIEDLL